MLVVVRGVVAVAAAVTGGAWAAVWEPLVFGHVHLAHQHLPAVALRVGWRAERNTIGLADRQNTRENVHRHIGEYWTHR